MSKGELYDILDVGIGNKFDVFDRDGRNCILIIKKEFKYKEHRVIYNGHFYYLVGKDKNILGQSKKLSDLVPQSVINQL
tara:strand:+ start:613 stop:849 length:237 start_codon:yes stop_codon:yes gene_type:complete